MTKDRQYSHAREWAAQQIPYHLRDLPSVAFQRRHVTPAFAKFCNQHVLLKLHLTGYKFAQKQETARQIKFSSPPVVGKSSL